MRIRHHPQAAAVWALVLLAAATGSTRAGSPDPAVRPAVPGTERPGRLVPGQIIIQLSPEAQAAAPYRAELGNSGRTGLGSLDTALAGIDAVRVAPALRFPPAEDNDAARRLVRYYLVSYAGDIDPGAAAVRISASPEVQSAEPNGVVFTTAAPNDSLFPDQWAHRNTGQAVAYNGGLVGTPDCDTDTDLAWDQTTGSAGVTIAIIDTGVDGGHPEFAGRILAGYDFINNDADPTDDAGHGTCCAGVAAAKGNNGEGVAGVTWNARIMPVKILNQNGEGNFTAAANGILWAADHGAQILSMSFGSTMGSSLVEDACAYAFGRGCALFCAAGNGNYPALHYPAAYTDYTIPVGALSPCNERKNPGSCDGEDWWGSNYNGLAFLTPGVRMHTTDIRGAGGSDPGDYNDEFNGTSAATPHAAGIGALVLSLHPGLLPADLETILKKSAEDMGPIGVDTETGYGRLNAHIAVLSANTTPVFVKAAYTGYENGSLHRPYRTFGAGVTAVDPGGTIIVFAGAYPEAMTITKAMVVYGKDGIAAIGP